MILDEMRERFLIVGFTGPLRSGCTTAATFLKEELQKEAKKAKKEKEKCQSNIIKAYSKIYEQKKTYIEKKGKISDYNDKLWDLRKKLLEDIKMRKIWNTLSNYEEDSLINISMTDMLLKTAVEYFWSHKEKEEEIIKANDEIEITNYELVLGQIKQMDFKYLDKIVGNKEECINDLINKRKYHELRPDKRDRISTYNKYLIDISTLRTKIQKAFIEKDKNNGREFLGKVLQDMGDNIRKCLNPFNSNAHYNEKSESLWKLSEQANDVIKFYKNRYRFWEGKNEYKEFQKPHIFVIENFRNPAEAEYFRLRYYEFFLISIHCNKKIRLKRENDNINKIYKLQRLTEEKIESYFTKIDQRDCGKEIKSKEDLCKQNVSGSVYIADIAIINETGIDDFKNKLLKYYILIRHPGIFHPSNDELFMHIAYSMSLRSKCISRKVGAVIVGERGYIIGAGWNEVGEGLNGCGDRIIKDIITDKKGEYIPIEMEGKDEFRKYLLDKYKYKLDHSFCFRSEYEKYLTKSANGGENAAVKAQQYCRALHAEENAIIQTAKIGGVGVRNGTMYTTTFPCELCAKKIYQSKIKKIVYTEPYPEAISEAVFLKDGLLPVLIEPFEGVKSHSYYRLYKPALNVKDLQALENL